MPRGEVMQIIEIEMNGKRKKLQLLDIRFSVVGDPHRTIEMQPDDILAEAITEIVMAVLPTRQGNGNWRKS